LIYSFFGKGIIGKKISIDEFPQESFTVVGGLARASFSGIVPNNCNREIFGSWLISESTVFIPYPLLRDIAKPWYQFTDDPEDKDFYRTIVSQIKIDPKKGLANSVKNVSREVDDFIKKQYGEDKKFGWNLPVVERLIDEWEFQAKEANTFILYIGAVSLLASIISILSIMLLSVFKRTSEIGLRRAIGARKRDIFFQFLIEALVITGIGGMFGVIFGIIGIKVIGWYASLKMVIPIYSIFISIGTAIAIGVIGGVYPAIKAANIPPAEAVRYE